MPMYFRFGRARVRKAGGAPAGGGIQMSDHPGVQRLYPPRLLGGQFPDHGTGSMVSWPE